MVKEVKEKKAKEVKAKETKAKVKPEAKKVVKTTAKKEAVKVEKPKKEKTVKAVEVPALEAIIPEVALEVTLPEVKSEKKSKVKKEFKSGTGRRKTAIASVFLYEQKGDFIVNGVNIQDYFKTEQEHSKWMRPFHVLGIAHPTSRFSASVKVSGSGVSSQLGAIVHGFSRALASVSDEYSEILHKTDLLTRDSRMVERKKYFLRKARKAPQYSKR